MPKLEEKYVSKGWLAIEPLFGMVLPGESATISLYCYVEEEVGRAVAHARDVLQDILIMRLESGADFFVTVTGTYVPSCFCLTVGELVQVSPHAVSMWMACCVDAHVAALCSPHEHPIG